MTLVRPLLFVWLFLATLAPSLAATGDSLDLSAFHLTFDDEFNSFSEVRSGSTAHAWISNGNGGNTKYNAPERQYYGNPTAGGFNPFTLRGGALTITARPGSAPDGGQYRSGMIQSKNIFHQLYGYFEIRAKLAQGPGMWPAFWLLPYVPRWPPELDIMESTGSVRPDGVGGPNNYAVTIHSGIGGGDHANGQWVSVGPNIYNTYNTYGADWEPDFVVFYFNQKEVFRGATPADWNVPMYMLANLAVAGSGAFPGVSPAGGTSTYSIDYIRAYSKDPNVPAVAPQPLSPPDGPPQPLPLLLPGPVLPKDAAIQWGNPATGFQPGQSGNPGGLRRP
jgi:hypothetical protein